ncbi:TRM11 family SAM-dependent methyltransferase [Clostridium butyricum]|uniref:TRM11 family SAM-dependent methyltransferase n=1 Tax=Clostridium butyricum TaxID=1492 RepID=UPI00168BB088
MNSDDVKEEKEFEKYFYIINYNREFEEELCMMEMDSFFNMKPLKKQFFANKYINPSRSPFIKEVIKIKYVENSIEEILLNIKSDNLAYENFKVCFMKSEDNTVGYKERINSIKEIGYIIKGEADIHNPEIIFGLCKVGDKWIFGEYYRNDFKWHIHDKKPYSYSNSLSLRVARALVNISVGNNINQKFIDPCCGIGTVIIEALSMGINAHGWEINDNIAENAQKNLEFFGYDNVIVNGDMTTIKDKFDVAIIDMPYGLFTPITKEEQVAIINSARRITNKLIIVTFEDMSEVIKKSGFNIIDTGHVAKGKFKRYISVCI